MTSAEVNFKNVGLGALLLLSGTCSSFAVTTLYCGYRNSHQNWWPTTITSSAEAGFRASCTENRTRAVPQEQHHNNEDGNDRPRQFNLEAVKDLRWFGGVGRTGAKLHQGIAQQTRNHDENCSRNGQNEKSQLINFGSRSRSCREGRRGGACAALHGKAHNYYGCDRSADGGGRLQVVRFRSMQDLQQVCGTRKVAMQVRVRRLSAT
jgi:hypothetical protein